MKVGDKALYKGQVVEVIWPSTKTTRIKHPDGTTEAVPTPEVLEVPVETGLSKEMSQELMKMVPAVEPLPPSLLTHPLPPEELEALRAQVDQALEGGPQYPIVTNYPVEWDKTAPKVDITIDAGGIPEVTPEELPAPPRRKILNLKKIQENEQPGYPKNRIRRPKFS